MQESCINMNDTRRDSAATAAAVSNNSNNNNNNNDSGDDEHWKKVNILLAINRAYQEVLDEKLAKLNDLLQRNLQKQVRKI